MNIKTKKNLIINIVIGSGFGLILARYLCSSTELIPTISNWS
tara:strand:+ start:90 stop:215 length:126 start_codon:yes stop_codon:yes gene_type:complete